MQSFQNEMQTTVLILKDSVHRVQLSAMGSVFYVLNNFKIIWIFF